MNRLAAEFAAHAGRPNWRGPTAEIMATTQALLSDRVSREPDFWSVVGVTELRLLAALAARDLATSASTLHAEFADLQGRVAAPSHWASVADQLNLVLPGYVARVKNRQEVQAAKALLAQVEGFAAGGTLD